MTITRARVQDRPCAVRRAAPGIAPGIAPTRDQIIAAALSADRTDPLYRALEAAMHKYGQLLNEEMPRAYPEPFVMPSPSDEVEAFIVEMYLYAIEAEGLRPFLICGH